MRGVCHFFTILVATVMTLEISEKRGQNRSSTPKMLSFGEKTAKISPADPEIICLREIIKKEKIKKRKKERNYGK